jgi:hypothetical protein
MKQLLFLLVFSIFTITVSAQLPGELKWKENVVKNRIQVQIQWNHKYEKGKPKKEGYKNFSKTYDRNGNILEEIYYSTGKEERVDQRLIYKYDDRDNRIEHINTKVSYNKILLKQTFTYDNSGRKIKEDRFNGSEYEILKYSYDTKNRMLEIIKTDTLNNILQIRAFDYAGNKSIITILNKDRKPTGKVINIYDKNGNIIENTEYDVNGKITEQIFYDFQGKLMTQKTKYDFEKFNYMETYTYDSNNNLIEVKREQPKGNNYINNIYKYDSTGNLIEEQWYDDDPTDYSKKSYIYNNKGLPEKVEVYYASYKYKMQYRYEYKTF